MFPRFLFFVFLFLNINVYSQSLNWSQFIDSTLTFSSPRTVDLNMDGVINIQDIILIVDIIISN